MTSALRVLIDVREGGELRGFHALAALYLVTDRIRAVELYRLGDEHPDERIACEAFTFDTGVELRSGEAALALSQRFDVYLSVADAFPWDETSVIARRAARRTIAALMFGLRELQPDFGGLAVAGHNTGAIGTALLSELEQATSLPQQ
jgi:hypothetical protein